MDEIDKIIVHSLRQIGCEIDEEIVSLSSFSPELIVQTVSKCFQLINPSLVLPSTLPAAMAQRFAVATTLAEACVLIGFRGDIGYQTFLYSNIVEVRRLFMFLIEMLPKENENLLFEQSLELTTDKLTALEEKIKKNVHYSMNSAWVTQYCRKFGMREWNKVFIDSYSQTTPFKSKVSLNVPRLSSSSKNDAADVASPELRKYWLKRSPGIFQETKINTLPNSLIHMNDKECKMHDSAKLDTDKLIELINTQSEQSMAMSAVALPKANRTAALAKIASVEGGDKKKGSTYLVSLFSSIQDLNKDIEQLRQSIDELLLEHKQIQIGINNVKELRKQSQVTQAKLKEEKKVHERTCVVLENPEVNIAKMEALIASTQSRKAKLEEKWVQHREPLQQAWEKTKAKNSNSTQANESQKKLETIQEKVTKLESELKAKSALHTQLVGVLQKENRTTSRKAYTTRILEIIGNIRKQKDDIEKVLRDTRQLQKQINTITGQLDRQFTVADDLLFTTAKDSESSKKAYKLLITLHSHCSNLIVLVKETGSVMREVRDLEDQIEQEKSRNILANLENILGDLKLMEAESKSLQEKISKIENQIVNE
ncbi:coiled-coil domain-containing protein 22 homolog [Eupeodes corollae]|uniref:coiled-coil domain-containing protein 22 homolog n=1 Tax=Eupeodes corollae TaxID=290404 RepID=UPI00249273DD|nr:coiled-coil domain-containing protein 22 homolog [Eupeodes corollae]